MNACLGHDRETLLRVQPVFGGFFATFDLKIDGR
jgi:hypothetical protein